MHRISKEDGSTTQSKTVLWGLALAYAFFVGAGTLLLTSPILREVYGDNANAMSALIAIGGLFCLVGTVTRHWAGEFIGGPLLATGLSVLGFETWLTSHDAAPWVALANLWIFLGTATICMARWWVVWKVYKFVHAIALMQKRQAK